MGDVRNLLGHRHQPVCFIQLGGVRAVALDAYEQSRGSFLHGIFCNEQLFALQAELLAALTQLGSLRHVARDLREPDYLACGVAYRIDRDARPQTRSVFAHAPTLVFGAAVPGGAIS